MSLEAFTQAANSNTPVKRHGQGSAWKNIDIKCGVSNCTSSTMSTPNLWFYRLPCYSTENLMRQKWLDKIGHTEEVPLHFLVCEKHFARNYIRNRYQGKKTIKKIAYPTLLLPENPKKTIVRSKPKHVYERAVPKTTKSKVITPVEEDTLDNSSSVSGQNLSNDNSEIYIDVENTNSDDNQSNNSDNQSQGHDDINPEYLVSSTLTNETLKSLNELCLKLKSKMESAKNKYSDDYKLKVFQLYHDHTEAYKLLQSTLGLPPVTIIPSYGPSTLDGLNDFYMSSLTDKLCMNKKPLNNKFAVICVNIMRIKPAIVYDQKKDKVSGVWLGTKTGPLQYAMIAMVRGIVENWHHVVSINLLPSLNMCTEYCAFIEKLTIQMFETGIIIKAVVTTADDLFQTPSILNLNSYFLVKTHRVYHIFDPVHLMLLLYEELNHYNTIYTEKNNELIPIASWEHINEFYEWDKTQKLRLTNQSSTVSKYKSHKNKLESAVEILSLKTAMGMSMYSNIKKKENCYTVDFLRRINSIFAALYPKALNSQHKVNLDVLFWYDSIAYIESIKTIFTNTNLKFPQYFLISMKSVCVLQSLSYLKEHCSVFMQCLNQDPLVEFIDKINLKSFKKRYPTETEFFESLRHGIIENNYHNIIKTEYDSRLDTFIEDVTILSNQSCFIENNYRTNIEQTNMADYTKFYPQEANSMYYISIYLLDKMYENYQNALSSRMKHMSSTVAYENKSRKLCGSIIVPDNDFIEFVNKMDVIFVTFYKKAIGSGKMFEELMKAMNKLIVTGPVDLAPLQYIKNLFLELRIYHAIKYNNAIFENNDSRDQQLVACRLNSVGLLLDVHLKVKM